MMASVTDGSFDATSGISLALIISENRFGVV